MRPIRPGSSVSRIAVLLVCSSAALCLTPGPVSAQLTSEARGRLAREAARAEFPAWQREFMRNLAEGDEAALPGSDVAVGVGDASGAVATSEQGAWTALNVGGRWMHTAIYDPRRNRMVVFGGYDGARLRCDVWALSLDGTPAWSNMTPEGASPSPRWGASAIYDPLNDRMVVHGGNRALGRSYCNDTWVLPFDGTPAWTQLVTGGVYPALRAEHSAVYDPIRRRMVVYGGTNGETTLSDTRALSLEGAPTWTVVAPGFPWPARVRHSAIFDAARDRMIVLGGSALDEVLALTFSDTLAWATLPTTGTSPGGGYGYSGVLDSLRDRVVVFTGVTKGTWTLSLGDTARWAQASPCCWDRLPQSGHSAVYDSARDQMVVFGGTPDLEVLWPMDSVWALPLVDGGGWTNLAPIPRQPFPREGHSAIYDAAGRRMVVFGGEFYIGLWYPWYFDDVWTLPLAGDPAWTELSPAGPVPPVRTDHSAIYDPVRGRMIVFGGAISEPYYGDVWALSLGVTQAWEQLTPSGTPPGVRASHCAIYDPVRDRMIVFGGVDGPYPWGELRTDVWALSLGDAPAWTQLVPTGTPPCAVEARGAVYDPVGDRMLVFGCGAGGVWALSLGEAPEWTELSPGGEIPGARSQWSVVHDAARSRMVMFGGYDSVNYPGFTNDAWALSLGDSSVWTHLAPSGTLPSRRIGHAAVCDPIGGRMVVFGGQQGYTLPAETWMLTWGSTVPVQLALVSAEAEPGLVLLTWYAASGNGLSATVYRCVTGGAWSAMGTITADGSGQLVYEDRSVTPGSRYGYRLGVLEDGVETFLGEAWVDVPAVSVLALAGARPNPATSELSVAFTLPDDAPARLEAFDLAGRRVASREVGALGAGSHVVKLGAGAPLRCGVYVIRLTSGGRTLTTRAVVVR